MSFWKKANKALGLGKNNDMMRIGAAIGTGGMSEVANAAAGGRGGLTDILLGKKAKDIKPDDIANQIRATQSKGLGELNAALDTPSENIVREGVNREKVGVLSAAQDARRNAQRSMAQQGLKGSSIGMALNRTIDQNTTKDLGTIDARMPGAIRNQQLQDAQTRIGAGNINQNGMNFNTIQGAREGGVLGYAAQLAPMAGSIGQAMGGYAALKKSGA